MRSDWKGRGRDRNHYSGIKFSKSNKSINKPINKSWLWWYMTLIPGH